MHLTESPLLMGTLEWESDSGLRIAPARIEAHFPNAFRIARFPGGREELQGGYAWSQGKEGGIFWKALPVVFVDEAGMEYPD